MRLRFGLFCLMALPAIAMAQMPPSFAELAKARTTVSKPVLVERYGPDDLRRGELRLPAGKGPFPVAVIIHGGCWTASVDNITGVAPLADALTARGFFIARWSGSCAGISSPYPCTCPS